MKKKYLLLLIFFSTILSINAQTFDLASNNSTVIQKQGKIIFNAENISANNEGTFSKTVYPTNPNSFIIFGITGALIEAEDILYIYDGKTESAPLIDSFSGTIIKEVVKASNKYGCLHIVLQKNSSGNTSHLEINFSSSTVASNKGINVVPNEQDCLGALPICNDSYSNPTSYSGTGNFPNEIDGCCLATGEKNDVWYVFTSQATAEIGFSITPNVDTDDYDWAVFDLTNASCDDLDTNAYLLSLSCNFSATQGPTGASATGVGNDNNGGDGTWNELIPVVEGGIYVINVSNYSATQGGYIIDFTTSGSTSAMVDTTAPFLDQITSSPSCGETDITFNFTERVLCSSVTADDFSITGPGGPYTLASINCNSGALYSQSFTLLLTTPLTTSGTYTLNLIGQVDDACGNSVNGNNLDFSVSGVVASISITQNLDCFGDNNGAITSSATGGTSPYTYEWNTGATSQEITGLNAQTYTVTITDNLGVCKDIQSITLTQPTELSIDSVNFVSPLCFNDANGTANVVTVSGGTSSSGDYSYSWSTSPVQNSQTATGLAAGTYNVTITDDNSCETTISVTITQPSLLQISSSKTDVLCYGENNGTATVTPNGGTTPYTYNWENNTGSQIGIADNITDLIAGTYYITVTDNNLCTTIESVTILEPTDLTITNIYLHNITCNGVNDGYGIITCTGGTAPLSYLWSNGQTTDSIGGLSLGNYNLIITDAHNCTVLDTITVTEPAILTASITESDASCHGFTDGFIDLTPTGGTIPYNYLWSNFETTQNISGGIGNYTVTITDANDCHYTTSGTINEPDTITVTFNTTESVCGGATGSATVNPIGGDNNFTYLWNCIPEQTTQTAINLASGVYNVTVTDGNNCQYIETINVNDLGAAVIAIDTSNNIDCYGDTTGFAHVSILSGTGPYSYSWINEFNNIISTNNSIQNVPAGIYSVIVLDNGCSSNATVNITENLELVSTISAINVSCYGAHDGQAIINTEGGYGTYTYSWSQNEILENSSANNLEAGVYYVTVTDALSCKDSVQFSISQPNIISIDFIDYNDVNCYGDSTGSATISVLGGTPPYTQYIWNNGETSSTAIHLSEGYNSVTVIDSLACSITDSIMIYQPEDAISLTIITTNSYVGGNIGSIEINVVGGTSPYTFEWSHDSLLNTNIAGNLTEGNYYLTITDALACQKDTLASIINNAYDDPSATNIPSEIEPIIPSVITPNFDGKNDFFRIKNINSVEQLDIKIFNRWGDIIFSYTGSGLEYLDVSKQWDGTFNGKTLPLGSYLYIIKLNNIAETYTGTVTIVR